MRSFLRSVPGLLHLKRFLWYYFTFLKNIIRISWCSHDGKLFVSHSNGSLMVLPYRSIWQAEARQLNIMNNGYLQHLGSKYTTNGFKIEHDDIVIDCGAFVGGFSIAAARLYGAETVIAVEPTPLSRQCLYINSAIHNVADKIQVVPVGLGAKAGNFELNISRSGCDNSFLTPDAGATGEKIMVSVVTFEQLVSQLGINKNANILLKVEAEGLEPEVIKGIAARKPQKIVIDITPERDGISPVNKLIPMLDKLGYTLVGQNDRCLFAVFKK